MYEAQRRMTRNFLEGSRKKRLSYTPRGLWEAWKAVDPAKKIYFGTIAGLVITLVPSTVLFIGSRSFHPVTGFFGVKKGYLACRRGAEWCV